MVVSIEVLGRTRLVRDGAEVDPGGPRTLMVLALLVAADGGIVDAEALADRLWRGAPPPSARTTLQGHVARLRRVLDPGVAAARAEVLQSTPTGYRLVLPDAAVDVRRFERACEDAAMAHRSGDLRRADDLLAGALRHWAEPYPEIADVDAVGPVVVRIAERHARALELHLTVRLELGDPGVLADAAATALQHPLREGLHLLHARALHAAGRSAEALEVLRATRELLADELGIDASPALGELELRVLRHDPGLAPPHARVGVVPASLEGRASAGGAPATPLLGRSGPFAVLRSAWDEAANGQLRAVVVTGEPGIGKSTLLAAFLADAGADVMAARGLDTEGVPPLWALHQLLGHAPDTGSADAGARFALGVDLARHVTERAGRRPVLIALDDLQWVDEDTLHVLEVALGQLTDSTVLIVALLREEGTSRPPVARLLGQLTRTPGHRRIRLDGLSPDDVAALATEVAGEVWGPEDAAVLHRRSGGNPFLAGELARLGPGSVEVPAGIDAVLDPRLRGLDPAAEALVALVALAGPDPSLGLVNDALDAWDGAGAAAVDAAADAAVAAVAAGLLVRRGAHGIGVRHDLVRDVVLADLAPGRRARLHEALAVAHEGRPRTGETAAAVAFHRSEAAMGAVSASAARACRTAAAEALDRGAVADALGFARRGLGICPEDAALEGDLRRLAGRALRTLGLLEESDAALRRAGDLAARAGDVDRLASAALALSGGGQGGYLASMATLLDHDDSLLRAAIAAAEPSHERLSALLAAAAVHAAGRGIDGTRDAARALDLAGPDPADRAAARVAAFVAHWTPAHLPQRLDLAASMVEESRGHPTREATALHLWRCALLEAGRWEESAAASRRFAELAQRRGDGDLLLLDRWWEVGLAVARGDAVAARELAEEAAAMSPMASPAAARLTRAAQQTAVGIQAWLERRMDALLPEAVDLAASVDPDWLLVAAQAHAQAGRDQVAEEITDRLLAAPRAGAREPVLAILLADVVIETGCRRQADLLLPTLETYGEGMVVLWAGTTVLGPVGLYRGGLRALVGHPGARADLEQALALAASAGFTPFVERAASQVARLAEA